MANQPTSRRVKPPVDDPDNVQETICDGQFYVHAHGQLATMIFTHSRPDASAMIDKGQMIEKFVVRARIVMTLRNLVALRDLLNRTIQENPPAEHVH